MTARGFAQSWWARKWIAALEAFGWDTRLQRGRSYARGGNVRSVEVQPGRVSARVKGSLAHPYQVTVELAPLDDAAWERVISLLAGQARFAADLLAGVMPPTIEEVFEAAGTHLFPDPGELMSASCTCPDEANPCKHIAAVHYVLGSEFDRDPFLLFRLRGRSREVVISALRALRAAAGPELPPPDRGREATPVDDERSLDEQLDEFWQLGEEFNELRFAIDGPRVPEAILKRLGSPAGPDEGEAILASLSRLYRAISERALRSAFEDVEGLP